ncbi:MAG TPA: MFS transporter [Candidatus Angelobacter sp.]|nr:MFS transporter [Candidatus Angelobacter sp.]
MLPLPPMVVKEQQVSTPARVARWWPLAVLVAINVLNFYDRQVAGAVVEPVRKEFGLSDTQIGWLNTAFTLLYGVVSLPLGRLADRTSRKRLLAIGVTVWAALTASARWINSYSFLVFTRLGVGVGEATAAPTATSWIGDLYPAESRSKPLALFMLGVPVGGALSFFFTGPIAQRYGWRAGMVVAALPALLLVPLLLMLHEPERGAAESRPVAAAKDAAGSMWQVLRIPTFWWIAVSGALVNFNLYAIGVFFPAFFARIHHMNLARAGVMTGIIYAIGGVCGGSISGWAGDRIAHRSRSGRMKIAAIATLISVPLSYIGIHQGYGALAIAMPLLTAAYGLLNMYYGLVYAAIQDIVAPALRGTSMALYFLVMYLLGASWGSLVIGGLSDRLAHRAAQLANVPIPSAAVFKTAAIYEPFKALGLQQALLVLPGLSALLAVVLWVGSRTIVRDMAASRGNA